MVVEESKTKAKIKIRELQNQYAYRVDNGDDAAELFTEDGIADYGDFGRYEGREELREYFEDLQETIPLGVHMVHNPVVELDGDNATGKFYFELPAIYNEDAEEPKAIWVQGRWDVEYVKQNSWKITQLKTSFNYIAPYEGGWNRDTNHIEP